MNVITTAIDGVVIIEPRVFRDARGYFFESFSEREFEEKVFPLIGLSPTQGSRRGLFVQDNESMSSYGVMRGLHFQRPPFAQSKLVRCVQGAVLDVAVDIRKGSPTYGQHVSCLLTGRDEEGLRIAAEFAAQSPFKGDVEGLVGLQFFIPRGFAHGFAVLSSTAVFQYKCDNFYAPEADGGISILDDSLGIDWHLPGYGLPMEGKSSLSREDLGGSALLSDKDTTHPLLKDFDSPFSINMNLYPEF